MFRGSCDFNLQQVEFRLHDLQSDRERLFAVSAFGVLASFTSAKMNGNIELRFCRYLLFSIVQSSRKAREKQSLCNAL